MRTFFVVWTGQLVSLVGSGLTGFALAVWVFQETGSVTRLAGVALFLSVPSVLLAPVAGALVDRWDRRLAMLGADAVAGASTLVIAFLFFSDSLQLWHVYVLIGISSAAGAVQQPAWQASIPLLVRKDQLGRANGLVQLNDGLSVVIAPALAGALLVLGGLGWVLIVDVVTFLVAVATLTLVSFPRPERAAHDQGSMRDDMVFGWRYIRQRPGLYGLLWIFSGVNFTLAFANVLFIPLVVSFASAGAAGAVVSVFGLGLIGGSVIMSVWKGPDKWVEVLLGAMVVAGLMIAVVGLRPSLTLVAIGVGLLAFGVPVANTASQVIWQTKVELSVQGRVFSIRRMLAQAIAPIAIVLSGPLADNVFEPALAAGGSLAGSVGSVLGTGPGRGIGLMFVIAGLLTMVLGLIGFAMPHVRNVETELPDHLDEVDA